MKNGLSDITAECWIVNVVITALAGNFCSKNSHVHGIFHGIQWSHETPWRWPAVNLFTDPAHITSDTSNRGLLDGHLSTTKDSVVMSAQGWARDVNGRDRDETETLAFRDWDETETFGLTSRDETETRRSNFETRRLQVSRRDRDVEVHVEVHCH